MNHAFVSDNAAALCPEAIRAIESVNEGAAPAYGNDVFTERAVKAVQDLFETDCAVYFLSTGTAANALGLASFCRSHHAIVCHEAAHLQTDECGAPEMFTGGAKLLLTGGAHGKLDPAAVDALIRARAGDIHFSKPAAISLSQSTEAGTVYTPDEVGALAELARSHGLRLHMDGARFANAVASLDVPPREVTWDVGVDVLSFGGSKNGMGICEAVVFFDRTLAEDFEYRRKQAGQLSSKMRYWSAPWPRLLREGHWLRYARHANAAAARLAFGLRGVPGVRVLHPVEANAVFLDLPESVHPQLAETWAYYAFAGSGHRFMCSWQTSDADVQALVADIRRLAGAPP